MFGGKKEKALEAELAAAREENEKNKALLLQVTSSKERIGEQFTRLMASHAQTEKDMEQTKEHVQQICEMAQNSAVAASDIHSVMIGMNNGVECFNANHTLFMEQVRKHNEKIVEIVEKNKHFTTPMKHIVEASAAWKTESQTQRERAARMVELSKNMSVLSLNAAIEAGRMGESGSKFVVAAEEVRTFSERYEKEAREMDEELVKAQERIGELEEQVHYLNELLKENNISMGKLYQQCMQSVAAYDAEQINLRELVSEVVVGKADALQQSQSACAKEHEQIMLRVTDIEDELKVQKSCMDKLEATCKQAFMCK